MPGRSTLDNILVLQETIHSFKHIQGRTGYMILKLDLDKAYDWLEWGFVMESLSILGIPEALLPLIHHCISSATLSVNWNGEATSPIKSTRGLRQGDPLSLYLFVLCLERLGHRITDAVHDGSWKPFRFGRGNCPTLSHVCFADDLVLVAEASSSQIQLMKTILHEFGSVSGQKVNLGKSQVFFSANVPERLADSLSQELEIQATQDLGIYLGAPMLHQRISKNSFQFLIDRMKAKLSGWKAKNLSMAGRITLAQSTLANIPGYVAQSMLLPASVCLEVEKLCRDFIWGSSVDLRKCHLVSWEKICTPKKDGGLGFRNLRILKRANMMKLAWRLVAHPDKLWVRIMRAKYKCGPNAVPEVKHRSNTSSTWRAISDVWEKVLGNLTWVIRDGLQTRFWKDSWIPHTGCLVEHVTASIPVGELNFSVSHYASNGCWRWDRLVNLLPSFICDRIATVKPPLPGCADFPCWGATSDGKFTLKSAYESLFEEVGFDVSPTPLFQKAWEWKGPNRYKVFL